MPELINFNVPTLESLPNAMKGEKAYYLDSGVESEDIEGFGLEVNEFGRKKFILTQTFWRGQQIIRTPCGRFPETSIEQARDKARFIRQEEIKRRGSPNLCEKKI